MKKQKITFAKWCKENRFNPNSLSREFLKYGLQVAPTTIWYWQKGIYSPKDELKYAILTEICGFDSHEFTNFQK